MSSTPLLPTPYTLIREPYTGDTEDGLGNSVPGFGAPETLKAYSIAPHTVEQGSATATETSVADVDVHMPKTTVNVKDRFVEDGQRYEVVAVQDWTKGFHLVPFGIVVELRRVT